jgi:hypothetical protein
MDLLFLKLLFRHDHTLLCTCELNLTITMCLFFRGPQFLPPCSSPCPSPQNAVLASAARISVKVVVGTAHNSPQTSPLSRYKLERNYYYRPPPISPPPHLQLLHFLPYTPRVSSCRVFWRFRTVTKDQAVNSVFPTSAVRFLRQHNP